jgi:hypothetical protein
MLRTGVILLTLWTGFNLVLALCILFAMIVLGKNAPALTILYSDTQAVGMDIRALATINGLAVIFNACAAALCGLSLAVIWCALIHKVRWAFWALAACLLFLQTAGFASDSFFQHKDLVANLASSLCLLVGLTFTAIGVLSPDDNET